MENRPPSPEDPPSGTPEETSNPDVPEKSSGTLDPSQILPSDLNLPQNENVDQMWDEIGFHKPLGSLWFNLLFLIIGLMVSIVVAGPLVNLLYPYPESSGYQSVATGIFSVFFNIMDLGVNSCFDRFLAAERIKGPQYVIKYIQFYVWYKMISSTVKTTVIGLWVIFVLPYSQLAYAEYILIISSITQFPGWFGVFGSITSSLQHYNKSNLSDFVTKLTTYGFHYGILLLGRYYGATHPEIGELMGLAYGDMLGNYVAGIANQFIQVAILRKPLLSEGITIRSIFGVSFGWKEMKEVVSFGIKNGIPNLIGTISSLIQLYESLIFIPQYATFAALASIASGIAGFINNMPSAGANIIAEAYMNGKKKLAAYYVRETIRYAALFQGFLTPMTIVIALELREALLTLGITNYLLAVPFVIPYILFNFQQPYTGLGDNMLTGTNHPTFLMCIRFLEESLKVFFWTLWLIWLQLPLKYGINAIIWVIPCGIYGAVMTKTISVYVYVNRKVMPIKIPVWQTIGAPLISAITFYAVDYCAVLFILDPLKVTIGFFPAVIITLLAMIEFALVYFGLSALLGGWDKNTLREFEKATRMSGPSKFMVLPIFFITKKCDQISPFHDKYGISADEAIQEARELLIMKHKGILKTKPTVVN